MGVGNWLCVLLVMTSMAAAAQPDAELDLLPPSNPTLEPVLRWNASEYSGWAEGDVAMRDGVPCWILYFRNDYVLLEGLDVVTQWKHTGGALPRPFWHGDVCAAIRIDWIGDNELFGVNMTRFVLMREGEERVVLEEEVFIFGDMVLHGTKLHWVLARYMYKQPPTYSILDLQTLEWTHETIPIAPPPINSHVLIARRDNGDIVCYLQTVGPTPHDSSPLQLARGWGHVLTRRDGAWSDEVLIPGDRRHHAGNGQSALVASAAGWWLPMTTTGSESLDGGVFNWLAGAEEPAWVVDEEQARDDLGSPFFWIGLDAISGDDGLTVAAATRANSNRPGGNDTIWILQHDGLWSVAAMLANHTSRPTLVEDDGRLWLGTHGGIPSTPRVFELVPSDAPDVPATSINGSRPDGRFTPAVHPAALACLVGALAMTRRRL